VADPVRLLDLPEMVTVQEYAAWARISRTKAYESVRAGMVESRRFGRIIRIPRRALERLLTGENASVANRPGDSLPEDHYRRGSQR
jgi:excisionase family DNA binding protein